MKRNYTAKDLWAFVNRAETIDQITTAEEFLRKANIKILNEDLDLFDDLMNALAYKSREHYWNAQGPRKTYAV